MPRSGMSPQVSGSIGGLRSWALTPDRSARTKPARDARLQRFVDEVRSALPGITDEADIMRRARMLRRAEMKRLSALAAQARRKGGGRPT